MEIEAHTALPKKALSAISSVFIFRGGGTLKLKLIVVEIMIHWGKDEQFHLLGG